jgi:TonB family protein
VRTIAALVLLGLVSQQSSIPRLNSISAREHIGEMATVCGQVIGSGCSRPTIGAVISFATNDDHRFELRIPVEERQDFGKNPEDLFLNRILCATGTIEKRERREEIVVTDPKAIEILPDRPALPPFFPDIHRPCDPDVTVPKVKKEAKPQYTQRALQERIEGTVLMQVVVEADGTVGGMRVVRSLHRDLDKEALDATHRWRFEPGTFQGHPAAVVVTMEMTFTLRK